MPRKAETRDPYVILEEDSVPLLILIRDLFEEKSFNELSIKELRRLETVCSLLKKNFTAVEKLASQLLTKKIENMNEDDKKVLRLNR